MNKSVLRRGLSIMLVLILAFALPAESIRAESLNENASKTGAESVPVVMTDGGTEAGEDESCARVFQDTMNGEVIEERPDVEVKYGKAPVMFGSVEGYDTFAEVSVEDGKIKEVLFTHNAEEEGQAQSLQYAEKAVNEIRRSFTGLSVTDVKAIEAVDAVSQATLTSKACKRAVLDALGLTPTSPFAFGSTGVILEPGAYKVPVRLRNAEDHGTDSMAKSAFPLMADLLVDYDANGVLTTDLFPVTVGNVRNMVENVKYYKQNNYSNSTPADAIVLESTKKPADMPDPGREVPAKIKLKITENQWDGVYMNFTVGTEEPAQNAWLQIDYENVKTENMTGWQQMNGSWYYFNEKEEMVKGWFYDGRHWFYFDRDGEMVTGWQAVGTKWYYFYDSGRMLTGWQQIDGTWYYLKPSGEMTKGWFRDGNNWFYFNGSGHMVTGWQAVGTKWYYFYDSGRMLTGWQQIDGTWYYLKSGGEMVKGWQQIGRNMFYFNGSGHMLTGKQKIDGKWYTFAGSGALIETV